MADSKARIQIICRNIAAMSAQSSINEMWRRNSNDAWSTLNALNASLTGMPFIVGHSRDPDKNEPEIVSVLRKTLDALEKAVGFLNFVLSIEGEGESVFEDKKQALKALRSTVEWVNAQCSTTPGNLTLKAISEIISHPYMYLRDKYDLISVKSVPVWEPAETAGHFDVFISYRHRDYADEANILSTALKNIGVSVWVDREQLTLPSHVGREELANRLVYAIQKSTLMIFFETYNEATADEDYRGRRTAFNWQVLEQRYGSNLLVVRPKSRTYYGTAGGEIGYRDNSELAQKIFALTKTSRWAGTGRRVSEEPNFAECFAALTQQSKEYFGSQLYYSPQAGVALVAPEPPGDRSVALGDDVLVSLIRLSPRSAVALSAAGTNCERVLAVGPDLSPFRWQEPGSFRFADVFGHDNIFDAPTLGVMDETALLLGILGYAAEGAAASELLERALRLSGGNPEAEDSSINTHHVRLLYERVRDAIARDGRYIGRDQQWEIWREEERWRIRPCASAGVWQLSDPFGSEREKLTSLVVTQTEIVYRRDEISELEDLINAADASKLEEFLQRHPHLRMA